MQNSYELGIFYNYIGIFHNDLGIKFKNYNIIHHKKIFEKLNKTWEFQYFIIQ